ncbi:BTAD domain-containing putative transcriptional regulator [Streptomyces sp. NPDC058308]|uniref:AfsR/SARP family transcriptional regulator n=1 Tax=Streptomyces sp. NPDC058308 TaxID=3346440 RepID=UPI0036EF2452
MLGPLEVRAAGDGQQVTPRAAKLRSVLATLLVRSNEVVSVDTLVDELWGEEPPRTAMTTLQVYISQLRKLLLRVAPEFGRQALLTRAPGYLLQVDPAQLDLVVFQELHERGREALDRGEHAAAAELQRRALALWRGPLLPDTAHGSLLATVAVRLDEVRIAALEQRMRAELQLGHHKELVGELQALAAELPLHEEFHAHLMVALYRSGRQAEALGVFSGLRRTLVEELAIEPGLRLQRLQHRILSGDRSLLRPGPPGRSSTAAGPARTAAASAAGRLAEGPAVAVGQLPAADSRFTGRAAELAEITAWLDRAPGGGCLQITGPAGAGKTALAVAAAHGAGAAFPDGRVLVRLRGGDGRPLDPTQVLVQLLGACGAPGPAPRSGEELRERLRELTQGRRMLLVLDDVAEAAQLRALLPLVGRCAVLVTCRPALGGLEGPALALDALAPQDARRLLAAARPPGDVPGPGPVSADDGAGRDELAELCGRFPGPLRALAAHLAAHPHQSPAHLAALLRPESTRLRELRALDEACHRQLSGVYDAAPEADLRAARLLSLLPAGPFTGEAAATALGIRPEAAAHALNSLVSAGLLGPCPDGGGYLFPVLTRLLAAERRTAEGPTAAVRAALARLCAAAGRSLAAQHTARGEHLPPLDWFARRRDALVTLAGQAHAAGLWAQTVQLADAMSAFLEISAAWEAWQHTHTLALDAAGRLGDRTATVRMLRSLGDLAWQRHRPAAAHDFYQRALRAGEGGEGTPERGRVLAGLADLHLEAGAAGAAARLVLPTLQEAPEDTRGCYEARRVLALHALQTTGSAAARPHFQQCLTLAGVLGDRHLEAYARRWLERLREDGAGHLVWAEIRPGIWCGRTTPRTAAPAARA